VRPPRITHSPLVFSVSASSRDKCRGLLASRTTEDRGWLSRVSSQAPRLIWGFENSDHLLSENSGHLPVALPGKKIVGDSISGEGKDDDKLKRHEVQVLRRAGHTWKETAALSGLSVRTVRRIATEATTIDNGAERARRQLGRPSKAARFEMCWCRR
jgi:hypothetical protein